MHRRTIPTALTLALTLAACGQQAPQGEGRHTITLSVEGLRDLGAESVGAGRVTPLGLPYNDNGTGLREVKVSIQDRDGQLVRFNSQNVVDPNGNVAYFLLTPAAPTVKLSLLASMKYTFTGRAYDAASSNPARALLAFVNTDKTFTPNDTGLTLRLRSVLGAGALSTLPVNMVVPGQDLEYLLRTTANGRADLTVPQDDYSVSYTVKQASDLGTADPSRGVIVRTTDTPNGDLEVTAHISGLVVSGQDDAVPGTVSVTSRLPFAEGVTADLTAPTLGNVATTTPSGGNVVVSGTARDNLGLAGVKVYAGARLLRQLGPADFTNDAFSAPVGGVQPADRALTVIARDTAGNEVARTVNLAPAAADPANVYVDPTRAPGGNGSFSAPVRTLQDALALVAPGGTVHLAAGDYSGDLTLASGVTLRGPNAGRGGTAFRTTEATFTGRVTISADAPVVLDGVRFLSEASGTHSVITVTRAADHVIRNSVVLRHGPVGASGHVRGVEISPGTGRLTLSGNLFSSADASLIYTDRSFRSAVYFNGGDLDLRVVGNTFRFNRTAINIDNANRNYDVSGNTFDVNGTALAYSSSSSQSFTLPANTFGTFGAQINLSAVPAAFRLDATTSTFGGKRGAEMTDAELGALEAAMFHGPTGGRNGLVIVKTGHVFAGAGKLAVALPYADAGQTVNVYGVQPLTSKLSLNRPVVLRGTPGSNITVTQAVPTALEVTPDAAGTILRDLTVTKTDQGTTTEPQALLVFINAPDVTVTGGSYTGQAPTGGLSWSASNIVTRAFVMGGAANNFVVENAAIGGFRQPAYINAVTGRLTNNTVTGTRGWVLDGAVVNASGNSFANTEAADFALLNAPCSSTAYRAQSAATLSANNNAAIVSDQRAVCP